MSPELKSVIEAIPSRPLLRIDEVANIFVVSRRTVYNWYEAGKLKGTNLGGTLRIYRQSVIEMIVSGDGKKADNLTTEEIEKTIKRKPSSPRRIPSGWVKRW